MSSLSSSLSDSHGETDHEVYETYTPDKPQTEDVYALNASSDDGSSFDSSSGSLTIDLNTNEFQEGKGEFIDHSRGNIADKDDIEILNKEKINQAMEFDKISNNSNISNISNKSGKVSVKSVTNAFVHDDNTTPKSATSTHYQHYSGGSVVTTPKVGNSPTRVSRNSSFGHGSTISSFSCYQPNMKYFNLQNYDKAENNLHNYHKMQPNLQDYHTTDANYQNYKKIEHQNYHTIDPQNYHRIEPDNFQNYHTIAPQNYHKIEPENFQNYRTIDPQNIHKIEPKNYQNYQKIEPQNYNSNMHVATNYTPTARRASNQSWYNFYAPKQNLTCVPEQDVNDTNKPIKPNYWKHKAQEGNKYSMYKIKEDNNNFANEADTAQISEIETPIHEPIKAKKNSRCCC